METVFPIWYTNNWMSSYAVVCIDFWIKSVNMNGIIGWWYKAIQCEQKGYQSASPTKRK